MMKLMIYLYYGYEENGVLEDKQTGCIFLCVVKVEARHVQVDMRWYLKALMAEQVRK